jgi:hypothetical protein
MDEWLVNVINMREHDARNVTVGLAEKAAKILEM